MKQIILSALLVTGLAAVAAAKIVVAAALPDLGSIASYIGGDRVECFAIAKAAHDPHSVEVLPTYMVRVSRAEVYLKVGLGLDQWSNQIVDGARNSKLNVVDCSQGIAVLERPTARIDASMGDVHPEGNPHYWLDPENGIIIAQTITTALTNIDPAGAASYEANLLAFATATRLRFAGWKETAAALPRRDIVTYHSSWAYFANAFGLRVAAHVEPVPGIPPTASNLNELVETIRSRQITLLLQEPYFSDDGSNYLNRQTGIRVVKLAPSCAEVGSEAYWRHFDQIFEAIQ